MHPDPRHGIIPGERRDGVTDRAPPPIVLPDPDAPDEDYPSRKDITLRSPVPMQPYRDDHAALEMLNFVALLPALMGVVVVVIFGVILLW